MTRQPCPECRRRYCRLLTPEPGTTVCPECGHACTPVYCAASTDAAPLLLAYTVTQAALRLGVPEYSLRRYGRMEAWRDGWRLATKETDR
jgi:hypothetical protein